MKFPKLPFTPFSCYYFHPLWCRCSLRHLVLGVLFCYCCRPTKQQVRWLLFVACWVIECLLYHQVLMILVWNDSKDTTEEKVGCLCDVCLDISCCFILRSLCWTFSGETSYISSSQEHVVKSLLLTYKHVKPSNASLHSFVPESLHFFCS